MRKIIEYTVVSADGVVGAEGLGAGLANYQDEAYRRDGLGQLLACDAMLLGRGTYEFFAAIYPSLTNPWADRVNAMPKYVFSSTLDTATWDNTTIVRGDVAVEAAKLKKEEGRDLLIWGHGRFAQTLLEQHLVDVLDISIYPFMAGRGGLLFRPGQDASLRLVTAKTFSKGIVKLTYEPEH